MIGEKNVLEIYLGFPDSSVGKESICNAGDPGSIPGLGRSTGEGIGYSLQYSWASLVAQQVENLPAIYLEDCCSESHTHSTGKMVRAILAFNINVSRELFVKL